MGRGSTQPIIVGNRDIIRRLLDPSILSTAYICGDSLFLSWREYYARFLVAKMRGFGYTGAFFNFSQAPGGGTGPTVTTEYECNHVGAEVVSPITGSTRYSVGGTVAKRYDANHSPGGYPVWVRRCMQAIDTQMLNPSGYAGRTSYRNMIRDASEYMHNRAFTVRFVYLKGPWGATNKHTFAAWTGDNAVIVEGDPVDMYSATLDIDHYDLHVPATDMISTYREFNLSMCGAADVTIPSGTVIAMIAANITFDDSPGGISIIDASEGGARINEMTNRIDNLGWQSAKELGMNNLIISRAQNGGPTDVTDTVDKLNDIVANAREVVPNLPIILTNFYDTALPDGDLPNTLTMMEEGFAAFAASDTNACFLNMFSYGGNHEQLLLDGVWTPPDEAHPNENGKKYFLLDLNGLAQRAKSEQLTREGFYRRYGVI